MSEAQPEIQKKLIIAFDAKRLFNNFTGLGNYSRTFVRNLQKFYPENEYHLFTPKIKENEETAYFLNNQNFIIHTPKSVLPLWRTFGISKDINQLMPDIYHGLSHEIPYNLDKKIIKIVTFHDLIYEKFPSQFHWADLKIYRFKYLSSARRADHIIAISKSTKNDLKEMYNISKEKISVVYQSCSEAFQQPSSEAKMCPEAIKGLSPYYLYVGSIIERKGLLQTVIAFSKLPDQLKKPFVVVGKGSASYINKISEMIHYYKLHEYFYFINGIQNTALASIYENCFALVYPSIYEGFGIPIIECLYQARPVITSDTSSMPEAAGPGAILINPYSAEDIKNAMLRLNDNKLYDELKVKGREHVVFSFSSEVTTSKAMQLYIKLSEGKKKPDSVHISG